MERDIICGLFTDMDKRVQKYVPFSSNIKVQLLFCDSSEDLHNKRIQFTKDDRIKSFLLEREQFKDTNGNTAGTVVINPNNEFTILIDKSFDNENFLAYTFAHELVHVSNNYEYMIDRDRDIYSLRSEETVFCLWDEFRARYISSIVFIEYLRDVNNSDKSILDVMKTFFYLYYPCSDIKSYGGMQALGTICACNAKGLINNCGEYITNEEWQVANELERIVSAKTISGKF